VNQTIASAVYRRHVGHLPAFGFVLLPRGVGRIVVWERHGMCEPGFKTAGERHGMCESALSVGKRGNQDLDYESTLSHLEEFTRP
jgi:hypothetical protein